MAETGDILGIFSSPSTRRVYEGAKKSPSSVSSGTLAESFSDLLEDKLKSVDDKLKYSEMMNLKLAAGEVENIHEVAIAAQKAKMALDLTLQIRNFLTSAYERLVNMR